MSEDPKKRREERKQRRSTSIQEHSRKTVQPHVLDVLLARGRTHTDRPANRICRAAVEHNMEAYNSANSRKEKMRISTKIVHSITCRGGRFLVFDKGADGWVELNDEEARTRVTQAMRNIRQQQRLQQLKEWRKLLSAKAGAEAARLLDQEGGTKAESSTLVGENVKSATFTDDELLSALL